MSSIYLRVVNVKADQPIQASTLPVSDKPVTLSFKGALGQKTALTSSASGSSMKKAAPAALGFSMNDDEAEDEGDEGADRSASAADKGLSHALRCEKVHWWMCVLTCGTMQLSWRRKSRRWSQARRYAIS